MLEEAYEFDQDAEINTHVSVKDPVVNKDGFRYVVTYTISLESNDPSFTFHKSIVKRNFNDFYVLRTLLSVQHPLVGPYALPAKPLNPFIRPSSEVIEIRRKGIEKFLREILTVPVYLSNKGLHLFLQSMLPMSVVVPLVTGKCPRQEDLNQCSIDSESLKEMRCCHMSIQESLNRSRHDTQSIKDHESMTAPEVEVPPPSMRCAKDGDAQKYVQVCVPKLLCPNITETILPRCASEGSVVQSQCHSTDSGMNSGSYPGAQTPNVSGSYEWPRMEQDNERTTDFS